MISRPVSILQFEREGAAALSQNGDCCISTGYEGSNALPARKSCRKVLSLHFESLLLYEIRERQVQDHQHPTQNIIR
jgi:hypothetical protein